MTAWVDTKQDIEQLMLRIRQAASARNHGERQTRVPFPAPIVSKNPFEVNLPGLNLSPDFRPNKDHHYHVNDLLKYHDRDFVRNAYRAILKREPDESGFRECLERLRSGDINKIDVLASLRGSAEGKQNNDVIEGLKLPANIRSLGSVPILGYLLQLLVAIVRLPASIRDRRQFEAYSLSQQFEIADHINRLSATFGTLAPLVNEWPRRLEQERQELEGLLEQQRQGLEGLLEQQQLLHEQALLSHQQALNRLADVASGQEDFGNRLKKDLADQHQQLHAQSNAIDRLNGLLKELRIDLSMQQARSVSLMAAVNGVVEGPDQQALDVFNEEGRHMLDALYASLEYRFRGERNELKEKFKVYLPYLQKAGITTEVLDLGPGRGEWLELLHEKGVQARGVDSNRAMSQRCREAGLDVVSGDGLEYLRSLPDNSVNAVTSFHVIEHLEFYDLIALIDEIMRVLKPAGLLILETPNPENVLVASCNFYLDPSHHRPIPSQTMHFLLEARGFQNVEVINLHPLLSQRIEGDTDLIHRFNDIFYGPMDYGIIAQKHQSKEL
jgi:SAM-dependent methyltransferase